MFAISFLIFFNFFYVVVVEVKENLNWTPPAQIFWKEISNQEVQEKRTRRLC